MWSVTSIEGRSVAKPLSVAASAGLAPFVVAAVLCAAGMRVSAQTPARPVTYTETQAEAGRVIYGQQCASCHGANLDDGAYGPPLTGAAFRQKWGSRPLDGLMTYTTDRMPPAQPGRLGFTLVARGKVMVGTTGRTPGGNYIVALDADTGKEAWRFNTIAGRLPVDQLRRIRPRNQESA